MWKKCLDCIDELLDILFEHNNIFIGENIAEDSENLAVSDQVLLLWIYYFILIKACILAKIKWISNFFYSLSGWEDASWLL